MFDESGGRTLHCCMLVILRLRALRSGAQGIALRSGVKGIASTREGGAGILEEELEDELEEATRGAATEEELEIASGTAAVEDELE